MQALEITYRDGDTGLRLAGELDLRTRPQLSEAVARIRDNGQMTLDLSEVTFIDSSGLHAIVEIASTNNGHPLILEGLPATMRRLFEITHLAQHPNLEIR
jgi:anti-anti-sigma factor